MCSHFTDRPTDILSSWIVQEVLSPQMLRHERHAHGDPSSIISLAKGPLPWEAEAKDPGEGRKLFYQVILGTIDLDKALAALIQTYTTKSAAHWSAARKQAIKEAILAVALFDDKGRMTAPPSLAISSFAWGLPKALTGDLQWLLSWAASESNLLKDLQKRLQPTNASGSMRPLVRKDLDEVRDHLIHSLGLPIELMTDHCFAIRTTVSARDKGVPDPLLFNPSLIRELTKVKELFAEGRATRNLQLYLRDQKPRDRMDILHDEGQLRAALSPRLIPAARWPGPRGHSLVLLQQSAVNLAMDALKENGILAVNGPPGTGKTTLLRDTIAAIIASRAEAMCAFTDPAGAFSPSGHRVSAGSAWLHLYHLDPSLKGFEILITSSNNKAVENISAELPAIHTLGGSGRELNYFKTLSDALLQRETWGLIAAVLGNAANREHFRQRFWWDKESGLSGYLSLQLQDHGMALRKWNQAKAEFTRCLDKSRTHLSGLFQIQELADALPAMERSFISARLAWVRSQIALRSARVDWEAAHEAWLHSGSLCRQCENAISQLQTRRPSFFARLLQFPQAQVWKMDHAAANRKAKEAASVHQVRMLDLNNFRSALDACDDRAGTKRRVCIRIKSLIAKTKTKIDAFRKQLGPHLIDDGFFRLPHRDKHLTSPWCTNEMQMLRDDVFMAAIRLHKAFIDAAAKPLRHNLGALMKSMGGHAFPDQRARVMLSELWSSLFLVVPCISTTFASLGSMIGDLPPESLGWLLMDEAGQALPQAAAGAIMRTKRALVVGDPMQIEPVTHLPDTLTRGFCHYFSVDPDRFNAPSSSAQTLADEASSCFTEFEGRFGRRTIGIPLLVHRRCEDPMFGISNAIAYDGLMVQGRSSSDSPIRDLLGPSRWIDIRGNPEDKWCPEEGVVVFDMLLRLHGAGIHPDLFIITPFSTVAEHLRSLLRESALLHSWLEEEDPRWANEHIGTVHTVQGREAQAVIFVMGAPAPAQAAAREWAGKTPNLLNVAVTRATHVLYVLGNRAAWKEAGVFGELDDRLPA